MGSEGGGRPKAAKPACAGAPHPKELASCYSQPCHGKSEPREAQMSTALSQVTGDLWLQARPLHHCPMPPYLRTQGSALPESGGSRKPGSELRGWIANPTLTYPHRPLGGCLAQPHTVPKQA